MIITGSVLLLAALGLLLYNSAAERRAEASANQIYALLKEARAQAAASVREPADDGPLETLPSPSEDLEEIPDYRLNPNMDMPTVSMDGSLYLGTLDIAAIEKSLPVMKEWSYAGLQYAPGRYAGSVYLNNMVIAAHNFTAHFGEIGRLVQGDEVIFTDVEGNVFKYRVLGIEILKPDEAERMTAGEWDLSLFTCTYGNAQRVTVRCELIEDIPFLAGS